jgi:large subunit ribosomal protein L7/L12
MELTKNAAKVLELIKELSLIEMNSLVKAMEEEFGVSAAAGVMVAGGAAAGGDAGAGADNDSVSVELSDAGQQKIAVIKVVKEILNVDLKAAKDLVEKAPTMVKENVKAEEAEAIKAKLEEAGAKVNLR